MTLDDFEQPKELTALYIHFQCLHINYPHYQHQKCSPGSLRFWQCEVYADIYTFIYIREFSFWQYKVWEFIRGVSWRGGIKQQWGG